jgi:hypothetical protein
VVAQEKLSCPYIQLSSIVDSRNISSQVGCTNQEGLIENLLRLLLVVTLQSRRLVWFAMKGYGEGVVEGLDIGEGWTLGNGLNEVEGVVVEVEDWGVVES